MNGAADLILVRATVNLQGLAAGEYAWVDPDIDYVHDCLIGGDAGPYLVPVDEPQDPGTV